MAREINKLNDQLIKNAKPKDKKNKLQDGNGYSWKSGPPANTGDSKRSAAPQHLNPKSIVSTYF